MKIELNAGVILTIPTGCKAIIKDNQIVIEKKQHEKPDEFKDGDILIAKDDPGLINIFKSCQGTDKTEFSSYYCYNEDNHKLNNLNWIAFYFRHATEGEKQKFFDKLKELGLRYNMETKKIERVRERAEKGGKYLCVTGTGKVRVSIDDYCDFNTAEFDSGNYFLPHESEQAEEAARTIRSIFAKRLVQQID